MIKRMNLGTACNNPLNLRFTGDRWHGLSESCPCTKGFCRFVSLDYGLRAAMVVLKTYFCRYQLCTVRRIVQRWAPQQENDVDGYVRNVCKSMAVTADEKLNLDSDLSRLVVAMARQETGLHLSKETVEEVRKKFRV